MSAAPSLAAAVLLAALATTASAQAPAAPAPPAAPAFAVEVVDAPAVHAIVLPMKGSYGQHPDAFQRLGVFISSRGLKPEGPVFARYMSDPSTPEAELVWEVGIPVAADAKAEAPFEGRDIPASRTAVHVHDGALEELGTAWGSMIQWVLSNGWQPAGPATQVFKGDMTTAEPTVELRLAVRK